jgi:uncharacterized protein YdcH (DUF465 family)
MDSFSIPALTALKSTDAVVIRQIVSSLVSEIDKLNKRIDDMENNRKKAQEDRRAVKKYGV